MWYDVFQDVLFERFTLIFSRVYNDIKSTSKRDENTMILSIFAGGVHVTDPLSVCWKVQDLISSSGNLVVDVMILAILR